MREITFDWETGELSDTTILPGVGVVGGGLVDSRGIHGLIHYIETRIVAPMGPKNDPDYNTFAVFYYLRSGGHGTPLSMVWKDLQAREDRMFKDSALCGNRYPRTGYEGF